MLVCREDELWIRSCSRKQLPSWETPNSFPCFSKVVMTLFDEYNLPPLAGEEDAQGFSNLTHTGVDFETEILYHTRGLDL